MVSVFKDLLSRFVSGNYYGDSACEQAFFVVVNRSADGKFLREYGLPDNFETRFDILSIYLFLWHDYLKRSSQLELQREVMDLTVKLLDDSLRHEGISDLRIGKHVKERMQILFARLFMYEELFAQGAEELDSDSFKSRFAALLSKHLDLPESADSLADYFLRFRLRLLSGVKGEVKGEVKGGSGGFGVTGISADIFAEV